MHISRFAVLVMAISAFLGGCARDSGDAARREVLVFAAASLREAMQELGGRFEAETEVRVVFNFAGSNDLARQIAAARGMDLFVSASEAWMDTVQNNGRLIEGTRRDLLSNALVVVAHSASDWAPLDGPCALASLPFRHLALGDPDAVPAGTYARKWLASVDCGGRPLWDAIRERVAPAPDVRAALGLVLADPGVVGMVYRTDRLAFADRTRVLYEVTEGPPIRYVLAQVADGDDAEDARRFHAFLAGPEAARAFAKHGFTPISSPAPASP